MSDDHRAVIRFVAGQLLATVGVGVFLALISGSAFAATVPDLVCPVDRHLMTRVDANSLEAATKHIGDHEEYRFRDGKLYMSPGRAEYFYGELREQVFGRYLVGNKVILFSNNFSDALIVHTDDVEVLVQKLKCVPK